MKSAEGNAGDGVFVDTNMLDEVQNLINRNVSSFWENVFAAA